MRLKLTSPTDSLIVATMEAPGRPVVSIVADTAQLTGPVPMERYVADQGGTRPLPGAPADADRDHR
jgi:hypothetical protein